MGKKDFVIAGGKTPVFNHYQLSIQALKNQRPDILLSVLRFSGEEALNTPWKYRIELTSASRDIPADMLINSTAQLLFYPDGQPWQSVEPRILRGIVTAFQQCESSADETRYVVTLESRLALLKNSLTYAVYQHKSVPGVVEDKCNKHGMTTIIQGAPNSSVYGKPVALDGHKCACGCTLVSSLPDMDVCG